MKPIAQRGIAIVSAIFILLVLALLGAFVVNISSTQQITSTLDVQSSRAYQAARTGIEWGLYQVNFVATSASELAGTACPASPTTLPIPATAVSMTGMSVTVTCVPTTDPSGAPPVYKIVATACNQGPCPNTTNPSNLYIERRLEVFLSPSR